MSICDFEESASYKISKHLYNAQKEFIVLGLCGKVGSGVSEVAEILEQPFEKLHLPQPGFQDHDSYDAHEYRILYAYAKRNWKEIYKIRTSSLITRHILTESEDKMCRFLAWITANNEYQEDDGKNKYLEHVKSFFNCEMSFSIEEYRSKVYIENKNDIAPREVISEEISTQPADAIEHSSVENTSESEKYPFNLEIGTDFDGEIRFRYNSAEKRCYISNKNLSNFLDFYAKRRREKSGFKNKLWYLILKQYLYDFLPKESSKFWEQIGESVRIRALQYLGNNLRIVKKPFLSDDDFKDDDFKDDGYTCLAEDINLAIKVLRAYKLTICSPDETQLYTPNTKINNDANSYTIVVIDSIKNPYESMYLRQRYTNYYLIGIYTEEEHRRARLRKKEHLTDEVIDVIDIIENNSDLKKELLKYKESQSNTESQTKKENAFIKKIYDQIKKCELLKSLPYISPFIFQNVPGCLETADILINNKTDNQSYIYLKKILLRYICLIMNPAIVLPTKIERCMQIAYTAKLNSGCISRQVGAALTDHDYHLLSIGWNQQPEGQLPCAYRDLCELYHHWSPDDYSDYENNDDFHLQEKIKKQVEELLDTSSSPLEKLGKLPSYCFKDYYNSILYEKNQVHTRSLHAEETAFLSVGANNMHIENGILFTTSSPCELCSKKAMYLGVSKIYYVQPYAGISREHVMSIGKYERRPQLILFTGAIGTAYTKLYTPLLPKKDENEMWLTSKMDIHLMDNITSKNLNENQKLDKSGGDDSRVSS